MAYSPSIALQTWRGPRRQSIDRLAQAHADMGEVEGPGRPLEIGRSLAHAYIMRLLAEFQAFVRDVYDLAAEHLVNVADPPEGLVVVLTSAITRGRSIDSGNATMTSLRTDFGRLGIRDLGGKLAQRDSRWDAQAGGTDPSRYNALVAVRNALAHGNQRQVDEHRRQGHPDTVTWGRSQLPVLNRAAVALDRIVWENLRSQTGVEPW
jgi:hypothetical protein